MDLPLVNLLTLVVAVISVIGSVTSAVVVTGLTNRLSCRRTQKEKLWDLRRQAYGEILSELHAVERILGSMDEGISELGEMNYFEGRYSNEDNTRVNEHMGKIGRRFSEDYLILSEKFIALFE
jgi:hypothetical protein